MSHGGFHVHGPDQHELEHQAAHGDNLAVRVSIMTAILATFGAVFSYVGSAQQTAAADCKNDAILAKNEAIQLRRRQQLLDHDFDLTLEQLLESRKTRTF